MPPYLLNSMFNSNWIVWFPFATILTHIYTRTHTGVQFWVYSHSIRFFSSSVRFCALHVPIFQCYRYEMPPFLVSHIHSPPLQFIVGRPLSLSHSALNFLLQLVYNWSVFLFSKVIFQRVFFFICLNCSHFSPSLKLYPLTLVSSIGLVHVLYTA